MAVELTGPEQPNSMWYAIWGGGGASQQLLAITTSKIQTAPKMKFS